MQLVAHPGRETIIDVDAFPFTCVGSDTGTGNLTVHPESIARLEAGADIALTFDPAEFDVFSADGRTVSVPKAISSQCRSFFHEIQQAIGSHLGLASH